MSGVPGTQPAYRWYVVIVLLLAQTFSFLDRMIMGLLVGPIRESFQISDTQFSLLAGFAFSLFYALMGLPLARIADAGNRRNLIVAGIAVWSVMTALCGLAKNYSMLFIARVGVGVGEATLGPAAYSMIADYFPKGSLARALSVYTLGVTLGSGLAYMVGGVVVTWAASAGVVQVPVAGELEAWQLTFLIVGLPGLAISLLMWLTVREPVRQGVAADESAGDSVVPLREVLRFVWAERAAYVSHIAGVSIFVMVVYALNLWGPSYFIRVFGYTPGEAGQTFGLIMLIAGSAGLLLAGTLADRLMSQGMHDAYIRVIIASIIGLTPAGLLLGIVDTPALGIIAMSAAVFFSAFQGGISGGALQLMTPNRLRGRVYSLYLLCASLIGLGIGPTVVALCTDLVFADDAAIGKSIALSTGVLCPVAALILWRALPAIRSRIETEQNKTSGAS